MNRDDHYIFDLQENILESLQLLHFDESFSVVDVDTSTSLDSDPAAQNDTKVKNLNECSTCAIKFASGIPPKERNIHYKSDLHRLNLKRSLNALSPLTEAEFEDFLETQSVESISGSEVSDSDSEDLDDDSESKKLSTVFEKLSTNFDKHTDNDDRQASHMNTHSPFILFKSSKLDPTQGFGAYKALFDNKTLSSGNIMDALRDFNTSKSKKGISVILMIGGGHFAGAVISHERLNTKGNAKNHKESLQVQKVNVVELKTFHRYTTRRKQGGSQSASDNARGKANSAGSSIRRYNEQALKKDVHELLLSWKHHISQAEHIFVRANGVDSRKTLMGYEGSILKQSDPRINSLPFTTKRATLSEVKNSWVRLSHLSVVDLPKARKIVEKPQKEERKSKTPEVQVEPESDKHTREIVGILKKSKAPLLVNYIKSNGLDVNFTLTPVSQYGHAPTPLHFAAWQGLHHMVRVLLVNLKCDPTMHNVTGKTACQISNNKDVQSTFQICRHTLGEEYCDWEAARVGPPKSSDEIAADIAKEKEEQVAENRRLIKEELAKKTELEMKKPSMQSSGRLVGGNGGGTVFSTVSETSGLTDQQRMRLMREQRARAAEVRMKKVGQ